MGAGFGLIYHDGNDKPGVIGRRNACESNPIRTLRIRTRIWVYLLRGTGLTGKLIPLDLIAHSRTILHISWVILERRAEHIHHGLRSFRRYHLRGTWISLRDFLAIGIRNRVDDTWLNELAIIRQGLIDTRHLQGRPRHALANWKVGKGTTGPLL